VAEEGQRFEYQVGGPFGWIHFRPAGGIVFRNGEEGTTPVTNAPCHDRDRAPYHHVDLASIFTGYRPF
jgi:hypothetical protein